MKQYECIRLRDSVSDLMAMWGVHVPSDLIRMDNPSFPSIKRRDAKGSEKYARHKTDLSIDFAADAASATLLEIQKKDSMEGGVGAGVFFQQPAFIETLCQARKNACSVYYVNIKCDECKLNAGETVRQMADK